MDRFQFYMNYYVRYRNILNKVISTETGPHTKCIHSSKLTLCKISYSYLSGGNKFLVYFSFYQNIYIPSFLVKIYSSFLLYTPKHTRLVYNVYDRNEGIYFSNILWYEILYKVGSQVETELCMYSVRCPVIPKRFSVGYSSGTIDYCQ